MRVPGCAQSAVPSLDMGPSLAYNGSGGYGGQGGTDVILAAQNGGRGPFSQGGVVGGVEVVARPAGNGSSPGSGLIGPGSGGAGGQRKNGTGSGGGGGHGGYPGGGGGGGGNWVNPALKAMAATGRRARSSFASTTTRSLSCPLQRSSKNQCPGGQPVRISTTYRNRSTATGGSGSVGATERIRMGYQYGAPVDIARCDGA